MSQAFRKLGSQQEKAGRKQVRNYVSGHGKCYGEDGACQQGLRVVYHEFRVVLATGSFPEKGALEQRPVAVWGKDVSRRGEGSYKGPETWGVQGIARRPVARAEGVRRATSTWARPQSVAQVTAQMLTFSLRELKARGRFGAEDHSVCCAEKPLSGDKRGLGLSEEALM